MNHQAFIESKGNHLKNSAMEKWKVEFLEELRLMHKNDGIEYNIIEINSYKLIGLPLL